MPVFIIRKHIQAKDIKEAIKLDKTTEVQERWLHEDSAKHFISRVTEKESKIGFSQK